MDNAELGTVKNTWKAKAAKRMQCRSVVGAVKAGNRL